MGFAVVADACDVLQKEPFEIKKEPKRGYCWARGVCLAKNTFQLWELHSIFFVQLDCLSTEHLGKIYVNYYTSSYRIICGNV